MTFDDALKVASDIGMPQRIPDAKSIWEACKLTSHIPFPIAELGVYKGGSARLICEIKGDRELHLFDTFVGMPKTIEGIDFSGNSGHKEGGHSDTSIERVLNALSGQLGLHFHKGFFPETAAGLEHLTFSLVHLDADIYTSTLSGLKFFYPRLAVGGAIIAHDYLGPGTDGVKRAFDEYFATKDQSVFMLRELHALVIKAK